MGLFSRFERSGVSPPVASVQPPGAGSADMAREGELSAVNIPLFTWRGVPAHAHAAAASADTACTMPLNIQSADTCFIVPTSFFVFLNLGKARCT